ncbi:hypothetical protein C1H46_035017 [Malus baccata]|uniref:Uncharacterized protein n=1 Tax=Malus baccata TaxID=106549 RepID=A0A540KYY2_MALBA|nr:hypothetical protein C1H46_035017 [Malus baccata]
MTKEEIDRLPKYKFRKIPDFDKVNGEIQESFGGVMTECDTTTPTQRVLSPEDAVFVLPTGIHTCTCSAIEPFKSCV